MCDFILEKVTERYPEMEMSELFGFCDLLSRDAVTKIKERKIAQRMSDMEAKFNDMSKTMKEIFE